MAHPQKHPLRPLTKPEQQTMQRIVKATSERMDVVRRARALLAVAEPQTWTQAARAAGFKRVASVSHLVERFNQRGLVALLIAPGRGRKRTYGSTERTRILAETQQAPDRGPDATGTWSLATLEQALRKNGLPQVGATTIRRVLRSMPEKKEASMCRGEVEAGWFLAAKHSQANTRKLLPIFCSNTTSPPITEDYSKNQR
jgi:hypothetical protein